MADNIRYARPELSDAEIEAVARRIGGGEWLETLPAGLQTDVGERGARLSMGQRQLVALTRVLVQAPAGHLYPGRGDRQRRPFHRGADSGGDGPDFGV